MSQTPDAAAGRSQQMLGRTRPAGLACTAISSPLGDQVGVAREPGVPVTRRRCVPSGRIEIRVRAALGRSSQDRISPFRPGNASTPDGDDAAQRRPERRRNARQGATAASAASTPTTIARGSGVTFARRLRPASQSELRAPEAARGLDRGAEVQALVLGLLDQHHGLERVDVVDPLLLALGRDLRLVRPVVELHLRDPGDLADLAEVELDLVQVLDRSTGSRRSTCLL